MIEAYWKELVLKHSLNLSFLPQETNVLDWLEATNSSGLVQKFQRYSQKLFFSERDSKSHSGKGYIITNLLWNLYPDSKLWNVALNRSSIFHRWSNLISSKKPNSKKKRNSSQYINLNNCYLDRTTSLLLWLIFFRFQNNLPPNT